MITFVDDEALVKEWVDGQSAIVGAGKAIMKGAHLQRLRSAAAGSYLLVESLQGTADPGDPNLHLARVQVGAYGPSKAAAKTAALAYANLLRSVEAPVVLTGGRLYAVEDITGPSYVLDGAEPRYIVDATFVFQPL